LGILDENVTIKKIEVIVIMSKNVPKTFGPKIKKNNKVGNSLDKYILNI
tara:strand:- start:16 stop:162 length:147 start_codon:yes stop_codon:yes gene_type:complete